VEVNTDSILQRFRLDGRTALVTGGGQGIGESFCHALGEAGASVAVVDVNAELAGNVADALTKKGIRAISVAADVTNPAAVDSMVDAVMKEWGSLTVAVNNAGMGLWGEAELMEYADWGRTLDLNLNAVYLCARAEARVMLPAGYGKIINTASMSGHISMTPQNQCAYNTSKAGVLHLTRSLGSEWAERGIRVNSISPGYTRTAMVAKLLNTPEGESLSQQWIEKIPMGRLADTTDLQGALVFLASEASDYMTGSDLLIDGGYCCW
jgi:NAD(P)-dependent dehydrogenase (short-subunit alcohol dehydrogenase family)